MPERGRDATETCGTTGRLPSGDGRPCFGRESDRKVRREIANSNERRRMQSINAGFQSLRKLLQARDKDKLSKASVLQKAVEYIYSLERERSILRASNLRLMRRLQSVLGRDVCDIDDEKDLSNTEIIKYCKMDTEPSDVASSDSTAMVDSLSKQVCELQRHLEQEHRTPHCLTVDERKNISVTSGRCRDKICYPNNSSNVAPSRRGSLETIVEAIRCLEGDTKATVNSGTGVCRATTNGSLVKEEYVLCDVLAAAEALQFIAARRQSSASGTSPSSAASSWQRQKSNVGRFVEELSITCQN